jgi:hypothetical protein
VRWTYLSNRIFATSACVFNRKTTLSSVHRSYSFIPMHTLALLYMCEIVCWWKCRMCENRIVEEKKHWRILYENDTKKIIQQNTTKPEYA